MLATGEQNSEFEGMNQIGPFGDNHILGGPWMRWRRGGGSGGRGGGGDNQEGDVVRNRPFGPTIIGNDGKEHSTVEEANTKGGGVQKTVPFRWSPLHKPK